MGARARRMLQPAVRANSEQPETIGPRCGQQSGNDRPDRWVRAGVLQSAERFEWRGRLRQRHTRSSVVVASVGKSSVFERVSDSVAGCAILTLRSTIMPIHTTDRGWVLETRTTGYAFGLNQAGLLTHRYWGARLPDPADYPAAPNPAGWASFNNPAQLTAEEYPGYDDIKFIDPCLKVSFSDGVRDVVLRFESAELRELDIPELLINLRDTMYPFRVTLHYRVHEAYDLIERWVTATNHGETPITLERIWSAQWHLPLGGEYRMTHLHGRWLDEMHLRSEPLAPGRKVNESRRLTSSHHHNPWFAADRGNADENAGDVWFGVLAWSGNWQICAEVTDFASTRISIGLNDLDFAGTLAT